MPTLRRSHFGEYLKKIKIDSLDIQSIVNLQLVAFD